MRKHRIFFQSFFFFFRFSITNFFFKILIQNLLDRKILRVFLIGFEGVPIFSLNYFSKWHHHWGNLRNNTYGIIANFYLYPNVIYVWTYICCCARKPAEAWSKEPDSVLNWFYFQVQWIFLFLFFFKGKRIEINPNVL